MKFRKDEGFTLVELMVVVLIIGILIAIAIPVFNSASANARLKTCFSNQRTIEGAVQQWVAADPANLAAPTLVGTAWTAKLVPAYIKVAPVCPGSDLGYSLDAAGVTVDGDLGATGFVLAATAGVDHEHF